MASYFMSSVVFSRAEGECKYSLRVKYSQGLGLIFSLLHRILSIATYPFSIRGGILGWNIDIYSTRTDQFDWSVSCAYVINIYIYYIPYFLE